jgi:hypothetical protein
VIVQPVLTVAETVATFRRRFIAALVCIACGLLLATEAASYSRSNLSEEQRLAYVCHECRREAAEKDRVAAARRLNLVTARATKATLQGRQRASLSGPAISSTSSTVFRDGRAGRSGRPTVSLAEQRRKARERSRAYRARKLVAVAYV